MGKFKTGSNLLGGISMEGFIVEVFYKKGLFDAFAEDVRKSIEELGIKSIKEVEVRHLYRIDGKIDRKILKKICEEILIDRVSQDFKFYRKSAVEEGWTVEVWFKKGVTDTVAETAERAIKDMGIMVPLKVSTGTKYILKGDLKKEEVKNICIRILANTLIQDYFIKWKK